MVRLTKYTTVAILSTLIGISANAADSISDFSLIDAEGRFFQLSRHANQDAIVILAYDNDSRDARRAVADLATWQNSMLSSRLSSW